jgi:hypothetical protein
MGDKNRRNPTTLRNEVCNMINVRLHFSYRKAYHQKEPVCESHRLGLEGPFLHPCQLQCVGAISPLFDISNMTILWYGPMPIFLDIRFLP